MSNNNNNNNNNNIYNNICKGKLIIEESGCDNLVEEGCDNSYIREGDDHYLCKWGPDTKVGDEEGEEICQNSGKKCNIGIDMPKPEYKKENIIELIDKLNKDISENFNQNIVDFLTDINNKCSNLGDTSENARPYINKINKFTSLLDFGDLRNSDELDFIENKIISFINTSDILLEGCFKKIYGEDKFCSIDLNINILLILAILYNKNHSEFNNIKDNDLIKVDTILNRLSKYFPDLFQKILNVMKLCDPDSTRYIILENIYETMFKYNNTTVKFDFNIFKRFINYLKDMKTIEMVVILICITFIIAKLISMFSVKVDV
jgi:hypothetical protein